MFQGLYLAAALSCWMMLILLSLVGHSYIVADVPYTLPRLGVSVPAWVHQWGIPFFFALLHYRTTRKIRNSWVLVLLGAAFISALSMVWLVTLARHDRILSLIQAGLLFWGVWATLSSLGHRWIVRMGVTACFTALLGAVYYGAIWGETRCGEKTEVTCIEAAGPRVWIPEILARVGVPVFAKLRGADLRAADLRGRDLRYADLRGADLRTADLTGSNLRRALIDGAVASGSIWRRAYLDGASFVEADLSRSNMGSVHAYRVDFRGADLSNTDFRNASLSHAYLGDALLDGAMFRGSYLRFVEGLQDSQLAGACGDRDTLLPVGFAIVSCLTVKGR